MKVYSSGEDMGGIAISLTLKNAGTLVATSADSSGEMKSVVHLDYHKENGLGTKIFTSARCEFVK